MIYSSAVRPVHPPMNIDETNMNSEKAEEDPLINHTEETPKQKFETFVQPCIAEFVGVCLFVFIGCMSVQDPLVPDSKGKHIPNPPAVAVAHGFTIALLVVMFGSISGAHMNPAVTLGVLIAGSIKPALAGMYIMCQLIGAIVGASLVRGVLTEHVFVDVINAGGHTLGLGVSPMQAVLSEVILTVILVLTFIMSLIDQRTKSPLAPLAIGFAVTVDILAGINTTGASMNPARSFGPAIALTVYDRRIWEYHYVYWVGPALGASIAGLLYRIFFATSDKRIVLKN